MIIDCGIFLIFVLQNYDKQNPFAKILKNELPAKIIYEDDFSIGFLSIDPKAKTHILVIPRGEYVNWTDFVKNASEKEQISFNRAIINIVDKEKLVDGYRLIYNCGKNSGQSVFHLHCHILANQVLTDDMDGEF